MIHEDSKTDSGSCFMRSGCFGAEKLFGPEPVLGIVSVLAAPVVPQLMSQACDLIVGDVARDGHLLPVERNLGNVRRGVGGLLFGGGLTRLGALVADFIFSAIALNLLEFLRNRVAELVHQGTRAGKRFLGPGVLLVFGCPCYVRLFRAQLDVRSALGTRNAYPGGKGAAGTFNPRPFHPQALNGDTMTDIDD